MHPIYFAIILLFSCTFKPHHEPNDINPIKFTIDSSPRHKIKKQFLSFAIDAALISGGKWWDDTDTIKNGRGATNSKPLDLKNQTLINLMKRFTPMVLRIGGSEADHLYYDLQNSGVTPNNFDSSINTLRLDELIHFSELIGADLLFTINAGPANRKNGKWIPDQYLELLNYLNSKNHKIAYLEFGNEVSSYFATDGLKHIVSSDQYLEDLKLFKTLTSKHYPDAKTVGPASAFWPIVGEPMGLFFGLMETVIKNKATDILSYHYYPTQSSRCTPFILRPLKKDSFFNPEYLDEFDHLAKSLNKLKKKYKSKSELWLGETGSAQCGGQREISDTIHSSFWWLDQLGLAARNKKAVVIRQSIIGGDYAILNDDFTPRADYYASLLWKQYMGSIALPLSEIKDKKIRAYAHCNESKHVSFLLINLRNSSKKIDFSNLQLPQLQALEFIKNNKRIQNSAILNKKIPLIENSYTLEGSSISFLSSNSPSRLCD